MKLSKHARRLATAVVLAHFALGLSDHVLAVAPVLEWATHVGNIGNGDVTGVALDGRGNVFVAGSTTVQFHDVWPDRTDFYVAKYSTSGERVWAKPFPAIGDNYARGIAADRLGNVFVAGATTIDLLNGPGLVDGGEPIRSGFLTKLNDEGEVSWTVDIPHGSLDAVLIDGYGDVLVTGYHDYTYGDDGEGDVLLSKYNSDGMLVWTSSLESSGRRDLHDSALAIATNQRGDIFIGGYTTGSLVEGAGRGSDDGFVARYDGEGNHIWTTQFDHEGHEEVRSLAADGSGNVYVTGISSRQGSFLAKYDSAGEMMWKRLVYEANLHGYKDTDGIIVDKEQSLYLLKTNRTTSDTRVAPEVILGKYDTDGNLIWDLSAGQTNSLASPGLAVDRTGNIYMAGRVTLRDPGSGLSGREAFLAKVHDPTAATHVIPEPRAPLIVGLLALAFMVRRRLGTATA